MATTVADEKKNLRAIMIACRDALPGERAAAWSEIVAAAGARQRILPRRIRSRPLRRSSATKFRPISSWPTRWRRIARSFIRASMRSTGTIVARRIRDRAELAPVRMESSSRPSRRRLSTAKVSRKFSSVFPALPSDSKVSDWAVAGVIMIVSSANSAAKRSAVGLAYSFQLLDRIPETGLDRRLNFIVTESAVHRACEAPLPARRTRTKEVNPGGSNHGNPGIHSWWRGLLHLGNNETA